MKNKALVFLSTLVCGLTACGNKNVKARYYCHFYDHQKTSSFDKITFIINTPSGRKLDLGIHYRTKLYKTYDEGKQILTVYESLSRPNRFEFFKLDLTKPDVKLLSGHGLYVTNQEFEHAYQQPFTDKNLNAINLNPELIKYLPQKPTPRHHSITYMKSQYSCRRLSYWQYVRKSFSLLIISILSAG